MNDCEVVCGGSGKGVFQTAGFRRNRYHQGRGLDPALGNSNGLRCSAGYNHRMRAGTDGGVRGSARLTVMLRALTACQRGLMRRPPPRYLEILLKKGTHMIVFVNCREEMAAWLRREQV